MYGYVYIITINLNLNWTWIEPNRFYYNINSTRRTNAVIPHIWPFMISLTLFTIITYNCVYYHCITWYNSSRNETLYSIALIAEETHSECHYDHNLARLQWRFDAFHHRLITYWQREIHSNRSFWQYLDFIINFMFKQLPGVMASSATSSALLIILNHDLITYTKSLKAK